MKKKDFRIFPERKNGWVRIVEAFVAILIITGIVLMTLDKDYIKKEDPSPKIYAVENSILENIQNNQTLRDKVVNMTPLPVEWVNISQGIKDKIQGTIPSYLDCKAKICALSDVCLLNETLEKDVFARGVVISGNLTFYAPKQLKIFCWEK